VSSVLAATAVILAEGVTISSQISDDPVAEECNSLINNGSGFMALLAQHLL